MPLIQDRNRVWASFLSVASVALFLLAAHCVAAAPGVVHLPHIFSIGFFEINLRLDPLTSIFLGLLALLSFSVAMFSPGYLLHLNKRVDIKLYWCALFLFIFSMALVLMSADAISFIVFWELMSLSSGILVATDHSRHDVQKAALIYLGATRVATTFLVAAFIYMHSLDHSWNFADWHFNDPAKILPASFIFIGFCIKAGIWPFHLWLPYAHPAAPAPVSALMSGVMIKIAIYGLIRLLVFGELNSLYIGFAALLLGTVSSFWGILFALVQQDIKRLLAYSSVENVGLALIAIAVALLARSQGLNDIAQIALAASIFHCVNHGLFKSLLFLGAGAVDATAHTRDLQHLGGLGKKMPFTFICFLVGSIAICALPPLNGFVSKWFIYQSIFQGIWQSHLPIARALFLAAICVLAIVGALALACFCKVTAIAFMGSPRSKHAIDSQEASKGMICAQMLLVACCVFLGLQAKLFLNFLASICQTAAPCKFDLSTVYTLPQTNIALFAVLSTLLIYLLFLGRSKVRRYKTWDCGFGHHSPRTQVAAGSFSEPALRIFTSVFRYQTSVEITGHDHKHFPEHIKVEPHITSILESRVYIPLVSVLDRIAQILAKIQTGSIHLYLLYLCSTLVALLILGTIL